jgi:hypothetical protein
MPGWNSIETVKAVDKALTLLGILCFGIVALLEWLEHRSADQTRKNLYKVSAICIFAFAVAAEIAAFFYSNRKDSRYEEIQGTRDAAAKAEIRTLKQDLETLGVEPKAAWRTLTTEQQRIIREELRLSPARYLEIHCEAGEESNRYSREIGAAFKEAGWEVGFIGTCAGPATSNKVFRAVIPGDDPSGPRIRDTLKKVFPNGDFEIIAEMKGPLNPMVLYLGSKPPPLRPATP